MIWKTIFKIPERRGSNICGHFGMVGIGINSKDIDIFRDLGIVSQLRGMDASGVFQCASRLTNKDELLYKTSDNFSSYMEVVDNTQKLRNKLMWSTNVDVLIGHVRHATKGILNDDNAHPFMFENIVGAHNGTLRSAKYQHVSKTDSELLFADINRRGIVDAVKELAPNDAYALVIYERKSGNLFFVRNDKRSFWLAINKERGVIYWASERKMLELILDREGIKYSIHELKPNLLVKTNAKDVNFTTCKAENPVKEMLKVVKVFEEPKPEVKTEVKIETKSGQKVFSFNDYKKTCECGKHTLNLVQINRVHRGIDNRFILVDTQPGVRSLLCNECVKPQEQVTTIH